MLTCLHDNDRFTWGRMYCFVFTEACTCRLELAYFAEKISKNRHRQVYKNVVALAYYGSCRLLVTGSCPSLVIQYHVPVSQISWVARLVFHALTLTEYWNGCLWITQQLRNFGFLITEVNKQVFAWSVVKLTSLPFERNFCNFRKRALYINSGWILLCAITHTKCSNLMCLKSYYWNSVSSRIRIQSIYHFQVPDAKTHCAFNFQSQCSLFLNAKRQGGFQRRGPQANE